MKTLIFCFLFYLSSYGSIRPWDNLIIDESYTLSEELSLEKEGYDFEVGEDMNLEDIIPLGMINVTIFKFRFENCLDDYEKSEIYMKSLYEPHDVQEMGFALYDYCYLEIYLENLDLYKDSIFFLRYN